MGRVFRSRANTKKPHVLGPRTSTGTTQTAAQTGKDEVGSLTAALGSSSQRPLDPLEEARLTGCSGDPLLPRLPQPPSAGLPPRTGCEQGGLFSHGFRRSQRRDCTTHLRASLKSVVYYVTAPLNRFFYRVSALVSSSLWQLNSVMDPRSL